jgi:hypothetical protein
MKKYHLDPESIDHSDPNFNAERQQGDGNTIKIYDHGRYLLTD